MRNSRAVGRGIGCFLALAASGVAAEPRGDNPNARPSSAAEQRTRFHVPPGFEVQLVADETQIQKPMNLSFDAEGRLWVTGSELYPFPAKTDALGRPIETWQREWTTMRGSIGSTKPVPPAEATDSIRVLSDFGPDGRAREVKVFADRLNIPIGVLPLPRVPVAKGDSVIAYSIPSIWRFTDLDGDGVADVREELYTGFGFIDTHGMSSNYLHWYDGWIYGCHGFSNRSEVRDQSGRVTVLESGNTYRFRPDGSAFEYYTHGQTNPFGLTVDPWGNFYSADSHSKPVYLLVPGGYYEGIGKKHDGLGFAPAITADNHGSSSIAGIAWYAASVFPSEFRENVYIGNPVTQRVNRDRFEWKGSTPLAVRMPDFLTCDDPWFRPVQVKLGPDGALYIADFYNPIIGHYEQPLLDPRRDRRHGRIWRVVWRGQQGAAPAAALPAPARMSGPKLLATLDDPNLVTRLLAAHTLVARADPAATPTALAARISGAGRAAGLWVAERLGWSKPATLTAALAGPDEESAIQAVRILGERPVLSAADAAWLRARLTPGAAPARFQRTIVETLARHPAVPNLAPLIQFAEAIEGGPDLELSYALRVALREHLGMPGAFAALESVAISGSGGPIALAAASPVFLADVALAVPTTEAAEFLLRQLGRLNYASPRAGDYLGHAARHLPVERLEELLAVLEKTKHASTAQQFALADGLNRVARERQLKLPAGVAAWIEEVLLAALRGPIGPVKSAAVTALRYSTNPAKEEPLVQLLGLSPPTGALTRVGALEAMMNQPRAPEVLRAAVIDPTQRNVQRRAAELIVEGGYARVALETLPRVPKEIALILALAATTTDAEGAELLTLIERGKVGAEVLRSMKVVDALRRRDTGLQARLERLTSGLPAENVRLEGIIAARIAATGTLKPDRSRGAQVFQTNCMACHKYRDQGGSLAPNLDGIAARGLERLAEDILDPNRNVDGAFRTTVIELKDGRTVAGLNLRETPTNYTLTDASGADVTVPRADAKSASVSPYSLMPAAFDTVLSEQDFTDLVSYLTRQD